MRFAPSQIGFRGTLRTALFHGDLERLVARGAIDGVTREPTATEDGFLLSDTTALISDVAQLLSKGHVA